MSGSELTGAALFALGLAAAVASAYRGAVDGRRYDRDPERALGFLRGFRRCVIALAVAGIGASLLWEVKGLLTLSLLIGGEELLESTVIIRALRDWRPTFTAQPPPGGSSSQSSSQRRTVLSAQADSSHSPSPPSRRQVSLSG